MNVSTPALLSLIRHGHTASNGSDPDAVMSGWTDLSLTEIGWKQAIALSRSILAGPRAAALYTSPLRRACDTAGGLVRASRKRLQFLDDIREIYCGTVDGVPVSEVKRRHPELWEENLRQTNADFRWPGGESYRELRARSLAALDKIALAHPGERVLVVTHCGVISQVVGAVHGISPAEWGRFRPGNASVTEVEWSPQVRRVIAYDLRSHLLGDPSSSSKKSREPVLTGSVSMQEA